MEEEQGQVAEENVEENVDVAGGMDDLLCMDVIDRVLGKAMPEDIDTEAKVNEMLGN